MFTTATQDKANRKSVTGRDGLIVRQALYYAVKYIDGLPKQLQEHSNRQDMMQILLDMDPHYLENQRRQVAWLEENQPLPDDGDPLTAAIKAHIRTVPEFRDTTYPREVKQ